MTYALAIHTASPDLGLAISNFDGDSRAQTWELGRDLSTHLHVHLQEFIAPQVWSDLKFIAVAKGPGGFTGTRIGVVAARTLAQQLEIPLFGVSTLAAIAWSRRAEALESGREMAVQMAAQREEMHGAIYAVSPCQLIPQLTDRVMPEDQWRQLLENWGNPLLIEAAVGLGDTAMSVLELAELEWQGGGRSSWGEALPFYGQSPV